MNASAILLRFFSAHSAGTGGIRFARDCRDFGYRIQLNFYRRSVTRCQGFDQLLPAAAHIQLQVDLDSIVGALGAILLCHKVCC